MDNIYITRYVELKGETIKTIGVSNGVLLLTTMSGRRFKICPSEDFQLFEMQERK